MSKLYRKPVEVRLAGDALEAFRWRGKWLRVESVDRVLTRRDIYDPYYGQPTYRARVRGEGEYDLVRGPKGWVLERVWD